MAHPFRHPAPAPTTRRTDAPGAPDGDRPVPYWAGVPERVLIPLYETVYERLNVGSGTRLLGIGRGADLALLMAAARGAEVTGAAPDERRVAPAGTTFTMVAAFGPTRAETLGAAAAQARRGSPVVLAGWGPPDRCAMAQVLSAATRGAHRGTGRTAPAAPILPLSTRDGLEELARDAGLGPDGSGRVVCPCSYPDLDSAVRGVVSSGLLGPLGAAYGAGAVRGGIARALAPYRRPDGTVRLENVFRYLIAHN